jgi:hypothetical protein
MKVKKAAAIAIKGPIIPPIVSPISPVWEKLISPRPAGIVNKKGRKQITDTIKTNIHNRFQNDSSNVSCEPFVAIKSILK